MELSQIAEIFVGIRASRYNDKINGETKTILDNKKSDDIAFSYEKIKMGNYNQKFESQVDDIIIHLMHPSLVRKIKEEGVLIPSNYAIIRLKSGYDPEYVYQILKTPDFQEKILRLREGTRIKFLKINDLKSIKIRVPNLEEQKTYGRLMHLLKKRKHLNRKKVMLEERFLQGMFQEELGGKYVKL